MRVLERFSAAWRRPTFLLGLVALLGVVVPVAPALASGPTGVTLGPAAARASASSARRYWTPARMRGARPLDAMGNGRVDPFASASFAAVADPTVLPFEMAGRVFVQIGKFDGFCSGAALDTENRRLVLTAGHCLYNLLPRHRFPTFARHFAFVPAYAEGQTPLGIFAGRKAFIPQQWLRGGNENFDMAAVLTEPNEAGQNVADAVGGGFPIALDQARDREYQVLGYPGHLQQHMQECDARFTGSDRRTFQLGGPPSLGVGCFMGEGASGGPWLVEGGTEIGGMTTYGYRHDFAHTFGPYFSRRNVGNLLAGL